MLWWWWWCRFVCDLRDISLTCTVIYIIGLCCFYFHSPFLVSFYDNWNVREISVKQNSTNNKKNCMKTFHFEQFLNCLLWNNNEMAYHYSLHVRGMFRYLLREGGQVLLFRQLRAIEDAQVFQERNSFWVKFHLKIAQKLKFITFLWIILSFWILTIWKKSWDTSWIFCITQVHPAC